MLLNIKDLYSERLPMTRKLAFVASLAAILATAACADSTAPRGCGGGATGSSNNGCFVAK
jgi:hypothetical protein